jgi:hypothetical protein
MRKLKLSLDALAVESFEASHAESPGAGTVHARNGTPYASCDFCQEIDPYETDNTCPAPTAGASCATCVTCGASCGCWNTREGMWTCDAWVQACWSVPIE